ncbi:MAG: RNA polymerase subunit sigma-70 [Anaerolineaceae bacterium]|nr:RNA polymerase subunit sigma-70 [Anaerolineaceae bacterium]
MAERDYLAESANNRPVFPQDFQNLTDPYQRELLLHCYRFLGTMQDAEDALQETLLRAWRRMDSLKDPAALRAWLYKIATHVSLDLIDRQKVRALPTSRYPPANPQDALPAPIYDPVWLGPLPEEYLDDKDADPAVRYELRESVSLAFLAVLQQLPARQRAVLVLRDVLGWTAKDVAETLDLSPAAVNSALQRARATMEKYHREQDPQLSKKLAQEQLKNLLNKYQIAWETADLEGLLALLRDDVIYSMPPLPAWFQGRRLVQTFLRNYLFSDRSQERFRLLPSWANGAPGFAVYQSTDGGLFKLASLQVLTVHQDQVARIDTFLNFDRRILEKFNLQESL